MERPSVVTFVSRLGGTKGPRTRSSSTHVTTGVTQKITSENKIPSTTVLSSPTFEEREEESLTKVTTLR